MVPPRGYIFIGLNVVRALSIIGLILVFSSSIEVMVTNIKAVNAFQANKGGDNSTDTMLDCDYIAGSTVPNQPAGVFWAVVSTLLIIFQTIILLLSECSWPLSFFDRFFPVLGSNFGLGALGIFQCLIGAQILSHHVDEFTLVSAFFLFSIGCLNMLLGLIFRESAKEKRSIKIWRSGPKEILPTTTPVFVNPGQSFVSNAFTGSSGTSEKGASEFGTWKSTDKAGLGFGRQGEKAAGLKGFILRVPEETLPRYATPTPPPPPISPSPVHASVPVGVRRNQSTRTSTSSFASPGAVHGNRRESAATESMYDDEEREEEEEHEHHAQGQHPMFRSSPTAL